jgi:hypothetical protein
MSDGESFFAPPPFKPAEALMQLQRSLRALGGLSERGGQFEWKGRPALTLVIADGEIVASLARRPLARPEWEARRLRNGAEVRRFTEDVRRRLASWRDADE